MVKTGEMVVVVLFIFVILLYLLPFFFNSSVFKHFFKNCFWFSTIQI